MKMKSKKLKIAETRLKTKKKKMLRSLPPKNPRLEVVKAKRVRKPMKSKELKRRNDYH